jgi:hypothetical protein
MQPPPLAASQVPPRLASEAGVTLVEVLVAIFVTGVGLLSMLALFPLGALEMARAIKSDRTALVAAHAVDLGDTGQELVSHTIAFAQISLASGSADRDEATKLRERYEQLAHESVQMELELVNLQYELPNLPVRTFTSPLVTQIRSIEQRLARMIQLLAMLEGTL